MVPFPPRKHFLDRVADKEPLALVALLLAAIIVVELVAFALRAHRSVDRITAEGIRFRLVAVRLEDTREHGLFSFNFQRDPEMECYRVYITYANNSQGTVDMFYTPRDRQAQFFPYWLRGYAAMDGYRVTGNSPEECARDYLNTPMPIPETHPKAKADSGQSPEIELP